MDDQFLYEFRKEPRPEFAQSLHIRLNQESEEEPHDSKRIWRPVLALMGLLGVVTVLLSFPSARAAAQQFLDLFRVQHFVAVSIDPSRIAQIEQLQNGKFDLKALLSRDLQVLKDPGEPQDASDVAEASKATGMEVRLPLVLPEGIIQTGIQVIGEGLARFTADTSKLASILESLDITDVQIPSQLNGAVITVRVPPCVFATYSRGQGKAQVACLTQANSPEITLPGGVFLPDLVQIGLRVAGLSTDEARRLAYSVDWHSTLMVPVPVNAASFREVELRGTKGLLIETRAGNGQQNSNQPRMKSGSTLLWAEGSKVYALSGTVRSIELLEMANAL